MIQEISVADLKAKLDAKEDVVFVDVREADEYEFAKIEGTQLIPLSEFKTKGPELLKKEQNIVIHCHHGGRSMKACQYLESLGYEKLTNVAGGIDAWSLEVDSKVQRY